MATAKDHRLIARVLHGAVEHNVNVLRDENVAEILHVMVEEFEKVLEEDNELFDLHRFRRAIFGGESIRSV